MAKIVRRDLAGMIAAGRDLGNPGGIDIETDDRRALPSEGHGNRQPDISETDDGKPSTVRHDHPSMRGAADRLSLPRRRRHSQ